MLLAATPEDIEYKLLVLIPGALDAAAVYNPDDGKEVESTLLATTPGAVE